MQSVAARWCRRSNGLRDSGAMARAAVDCLAWSYACSVAAVLAHGIPEPRETAQNGREASTGACRDEA